MTDEINIDNNIMLPINTKKIDIEKIILWALRKRDIMYENVRVNDQLRYIFNFEFVEEQAPPIHYDDIINEFDTEPNIELAMKQDTEQDTYSNASSSSNADIDADSSAESSSMGRAPNNTMLFKNWIEEHKIKKFDRQEFIDAFACITKEKATKIIFYQINKKTIRQMGTNRFEVIKEIA